MTDKKPIREHDRFIVRLPDGMKDLLASRAQLKNQSMNSEIIEILSKNLKFGREGEIATVRTRLNLLRAVRLNLRQNMADVDHKIDECMSELERLRAEK
jgi:plasmid stability protein